MEDFSEGEKISYSETENGADQPDPLFLSFTVQVRTHGDTCTAPAAGSVTGGTDGDASEIYRNFGVGTMSRSLPSFAF